MNENHQRGKRTRTRFARVNVIAALGIALLTALPAIASGEDIVIKRAPPRFPDINEPTMTIAREIFDVLDSLEGEGDGDGGGPPSVVEIQDSTHRTFGHWEGVYTLYKITNDADPNNRYYITTAQWYGMGTSGRPDEHGIHHINTETYHLARASTPYFLNYAPLDEDPYVGTRSFSVGKGGPTSSYSWTQTGPAWLRYDRYWSDMGDYQDTEYANAATYTNEQTTDKLEYAATGVIPANGYPGQAWMLMDDHSTACSGPGTCDHYYDSSGWIGWGIGWA